ncbi:chemosensory receptor C [Elysia marginata]|uniref:Chemosensory receptor C n=1 Tax=Elysia marginata TaxID=1093978 RepID=A0AAV4IF11_9GAST|nr:chemosensory receptor C [Elysia marginata]
MANSSIEIRQDLNLSDIVDYGDSHLSRVIQYLDLYINIVFVFVASVFALGTNIANMLVLIKQGVRGCVSLCLFSISATDFLSTLTGFISVMFKILMHLYKQPGFNPAAVFFLLVYASAVLYDVSNTLTAFLSLERCLCVTLPFKFKDIFTTKLTAVVIVCVYMLCFGLMMPHFLSSGLRMKTFENSTYLTLWLSSDRIAVDTYIDVKNFCQISVILGIVLVCTSLMIISLNISSKFHNKDTTTTAKPLKSSKTRPEVNFKVSSSMPTPEITNHEGKGKIETKRKNKKNPTKNKDTIKDPQSNGPLTKENTARKQEKNTQSSRNLNVIKTVVMLCVICFVCNLSRIIASTAIVLEPRLKIGREYYDWYQLMIAVCYVFQLFNCSLNIFVYYNYNQSFRETLRQLLGCKSNT